MKTKTKFPKSLLVLILPLALCLSAWGTSRVINTLRLNIVKQQVHTVAAKLGATDGNIIGFDVSYSDFGSHGSYSLVFIPNTELPTNTITTTMSQCLDDSSVLEGVSTDRNLLSLFRGFESGSIPGKSLRVEEGEDVPKKGGGERVVFAREWLASFRGERQTALVVYREDPQKYHSVFYLNETRVLSEIIVVEKNFDVFPIKAYHTLTPLHCS